MTTARKRTAASRTAAAAVQEGPASEAATATSPHKETAQWSATPGAPVRLDCQVTGYDADVIRAAAKPDDRPVDALRRLIAKAAQSDGMIRRSQKREAALLAQLASQANSLQVLSDAYKHLSASHGAMDEHLTAVTTHQQQTAQAVAAIRSDSALFRALLTDAINSHAADLARALDAQSQMIAIAARFNEAVSYLNDLVDAFAELGTLSKPPSLPAGDVGQMPEPAVLP